MMKNDEKENFMELKNHCNISDDIQTDCSAIKNILLSMCEGKIPFRASAYPLSLEYSLEYSNRELVIRENNMVISKLPFEIIYFDIKKSHLDPSGYEEAIRNILIEEIERTVSRKYA